MDYYPATFCLFLCIGFTSGVDIITDTPDNTAALANSRVQLNCTAGLSNTQLLTWDWKVVGTPAGSGWSSIYNGNMDGGTVTDPAYEVDAHHNLYVKSLYWDKAGEYRCTLLDTQDHEAAVAHNAEVMTLGNVECPESGMNYDEKDYIQLICKVELTGSITPTVQWYKEGSWVTVDYPIRTPEVDPTEPRSIEIGYNVTVTASDHHLKHECRVFFQEETSDNPTIPTYTDDCFTTFTVNHFVRNIEIFMPETSANLKVGDVINCTADGYPEPSFEWFKESGTGILDKISGWQLVVELDMVGNNHYICMATNTVNGQKYDATLDAIFTVDEVSSASHTSLSCLVILCSLALKLFLF